jgi:hypothetical protein
MISNRLRIVPVSPRLLVAALNGFRNCDCVSLPITEEIPEDAVVHSCDYDWAARCLKVLISHPSFDEVPDGQIPPSTAFATTWRTIPLATWTTTTELPDEPKKIEFREFL